MPRKITKVSTDVNALREKPVENFVGWHAVLRDIQNDINRLKKLVPVVERKIRKGEPWPTDAVMGRNAITPEHQLNEQH